MCRVHLRRKIGSRETGCQRKNLLELEIFLHFVEVNSQRIKTQVIKKKRTSGNKLSKMKLFAIPVHTHDIMPHQTFICTPSKLFNSLFQVIFKMFFATVTLKLKLRSGFSSLSISFIFCPISFFFTFQLTLNWGY